MVVAVEESVPAESSVAPRERDVFCFVGIWEVKLRGKEREPDEFPEVASCVPVQYGPIRAEDA